MADLHRPLSEVEFVFFDLETGVRTAIRDRYGLDVLPDRATCHTIAAPWRPYASVASCYCWRTLDVARKTDTVATAYPSWMATSQPLRGWHQQPLSEFVVLRSWVTR